MGLSSCRPRVCKTAGAPSLRRRKERRGAGAWSSVSRLGREEQEQERQQEDHPPVLCVMKFHVRLGCGGHDAVPPDASFGLFGGLGNLLRGGLGAVCRGG